MPWITVNAEAPKPTTFEDLGYVQVVRCKDCKYFHEFEPSELCKRIFHDETRYECWNPRLTDQDNVPTKGPDWFCADGDRREVGCLTGNKLYLISSDVHAMRRTLVGIARITGIRKRQLRVWKN